MNTATPRDFKFDLGVRVKDQVTGFEGVVIYRSQWLNGCNTYGVKPTTLKDGAPQESVHFDEPQLDLVKPEEPPVSSDRRTGGPERPISSPMGT